MSFIKNDTTAKVYAPGYFIALGDENCVRETKEIPATMAVTAEDGTKYVPMGTIFPSNDGNAIGIVYEDVDVTTGDMPGSVVTKGIVYEDKLPVTDYSYSAATPETGDNPKAKGWYERSGSEGAYVYTLTTDTAVDSEKTYYERSNVYIASAAKTALIALGFTFISSTPAVIRPY